jgi:hypothetical protein
MSLVKGCLIQCGMEAEDAVLCKLCFSKAVYGCCNRRRSDNLCTSTSRDFISEVFGGGYMLFKCLAQLKDFF